MMGWLKRAFCFPISVFIFFIKLAVRLILRQRFFAKEDGEGKNEGQTEEAAKTKNNGTVNDAIINENGGELQQNHTQKSGGSSGWRGAINNIGLVL